MRPTTQAMKSGISLIAVLMFMLAATTASVVVFRWIGSENFASGARLKQSEAYQAAESGIEATQAWLSSKGSDVGDLVSEYFSQPETRPKQPINLTAEANNILGSIALDDGWQRFEVYLIGVDGGANNNGPYKLKFLSVGNGRDGSEVKLVAVFDVEGLYRMQLPPPIDNIALPGYFGGRINFSGQKTLSSAMINGDWSGNPPIIKHDFVITGNLTNSGDKVTVGGNLCVGGRYDADNSAEVEGHTYIGFSEKFMGTYKGHVYCDGNMKMGETQTVTIDSNLTLNGRMWNLNGNRTYMVKGDLLLGGNAQIDANGIGDATYFSVCRNVWSHNEAGVKATKAQASKADGNPISRLRFNTGRAPEVNCPHNPNAFLAFKDAIPVGNNDITTNDNGASLGNNWKYLISHKTQASPIGYFYSGASNYYYSSAEIFCEEIRSVQRTCEEKICSNEICNEIKGNEEVLAIEFCKNIGAELAIEFCKNIGAKPAKSYCENIWGPPAEGCDGAKYLIDDPIKSSLDSIEKFLEKVANPDRVNNYQCLNTTATNINSNGAVSGASQTITELLNGCYNKLANESSKLYNGYYVVKLNQTEDISSLPALQGKFIFIYDMPQANVLVAPTTEDSKVMIFFKEGVTKELKSMQCVSNGAGGYYKYNYFIYSLKNIQELNNWNYSCPLDGNIYFPAGTCARVVNINNNFRLEENSDFVQELAEAGIICANNGGENCQDSDNDNPNDNNPNGNNSKRDNGTYRKLANKAFEKIWLAVSSRLKVSLASKNISREKKPKDDDTFSLEGSVLVMPRVLRLTRDAYASFENDADPLRHFYTFMYLNGTEEKPPTGRDCFRLTATTPNGGEKLNQTGVIGVIPEEDEDDEVSYYKCSFTSHPDESTSFYIEVKGQNGGAIVKFSEPSIREITAQECGQPELLVNGAEGNLFQVSVSADSDNIGGWSITLETVSGCTASVTSQPGTSPSSWNITCQNGVNGSSLARFKACYNGSQGGFVNLNIAGTSPGITSSEPRTATVKTADKPITITRTDNKAAGAGFAQCPDKGANWISVLCNPGAATIETPSNKWKCNYVDGMQVSYVVENSLPEACQVLAGTPARGAVPVINGSDASFEMDLEWKSYEVNIIGGNLNFEAQDPSRGNVPAGDRDGSNVNRFKVYHGASYKISTASTPWKVSCDSKLACNPVSPFYLTSKLFGSIKPTGGGAIRLESAGEPGASCALKNSQAEQGKETFGSITQITSGCDNATISYKANGKTYASSDAIDLPAGDYDVAAEISCPSEGTTTPAPCGQLRVVGSSGDLGLKRCWEQKNIPIGNWEQKTTPAGSCIVDGQCNLRMYTFGCAANVEANGETLTIESGEAQYRKLSIPFSIQVSGCGLDQIGCESH